MSAENHTSRPSATHPSKAKALALRLAHAENALLALAAGQVDAITAPSGKTHLLHPAQEHLRQSESRLQSVIESSADVTTVVTCSGLIVSQNRAVRPVLGYEPNELVGSSIFRLIHEGDLPRHYSAFTNVIEGIFEYAKVHFYHRARDGSYRLIEATLGKLRGASPASVVFNLRPLLFQAQGTIREAWAGGFGTIKKAPEHDPVKLLAEVFRGCQEEIIREWRLQAGKLLDRLHLDKPTITDHIPDVIDEIIRDLSLGRVGTQPFEQTRGSPPVHGVQRFLDGLDVGEVVAEYNLLRAAFSVVAGRHHVDVVGEAARIINHRIDESVRLAVTAFAAQQAFIRKGQEEEHLAFIAHDLRTPLNAVSLLVEELKHGLDIKALIEAADLFDLLGRNMQRVEDLLQKVMQTGEKSPAPGSSFKPIRRTFELWPVVQRLIRDLRPVSSKQCIEVINKIPPTLAINGDAGLISEVFQNLLGNAFEYAAHGRVIVSASDNAGAITCVVCDNGAGITPEMLTKVFDKHATDPDKAGTGLGLAIVKQIVVAHGGTVTVESIQGAGATFYFTIPTPQGSKC
jgi:two-component system phosphate regulon sensor histidine kinase PhoR